MCTVLVGQDSVNIGQLKASVNRMPAQAVLAAALALQQEGLVMGECTPFGRVHFNGCFAEIEALFQRAGYHRGLDVMGYQGLRYALFDPARWEPVAVLRLLQRAVDADPGVVCAAGG